MPGSQQASAITSLNAAVAPFSNVPSNRWVTSTGNATEAFQTTDGSLFTNILAFGTGGGPYDVNVGGVDLGTFNSSSYLDFNDPAYAPLLGKLLVGGDGVRAFTVTDLSGGTTGFTAQLAFNTATSNFVASTVIPTVTATAGQPFKFTANPGTGVYVLTAAGLTINAGAVAAIPPAADQTNRQLLVLTGGLTLAGSPGSWTGLFDIANNDLGLPGASLATVTDQIRQGYNLTGGGNWQGSGGITSTSAAADTSHLTALGVVQNNQSGSPLFTAANSFDGTVPGAADILVKYTYYGDANLDGKVDGSDYSLIDAGYAGGGALTGWFNGDFNYDGVIDGSDYALIDNAFNNQTVNLSTSALAGSSTEQVAAAAGVPEPASLLPLPAVAIGLSFRRRRRTS